jgi:hypothetical protein
VTRADRLSAAPPGAAVAARCDRGTARGPTSRCSPTAPRRSTSASSPTTAPSTGCRSRTSPRTSGTATSRTSVRASATASAAPDRSPLSGVPGGTPASCCSTPTRGLSTASCSCRADLRLPTGPRRHRPRRPDSAPYVPRRWSCTTPSVGRRPEPAYAVGRHRHLRAARPRASPRCTPRCRPPPAAATPGSRTRPSSDT